MRIALLDPPNFTPPYDHSLASALARRGHEVHLLASPDLYGSGREPDGYRREETFLPLSGRLLRGRPRSPLRLPAKGLEYVPSVRRSLRRLDALRPDVVHVQWLGIPRYDVRWLRRLAGRYATVLTAHDVLPRRAWNARAWGEALGLVDRVIVHSDRGVGQLEGLGVARARIAQVTHPVFEPPPGYRPKPPAGTTLLFFGMIRAYKGLDVLVRALPALARDVPEARLLVAGQALDPLEPLRELAASLRVAERIEWRVAYVRPPEIAPLLEEGTLCVLPYLRLDSSGVLATALGHARPVVVSDVGSLGTIVRAHGAGRVVPPGNPDALAAACAALLTESEALAAATAGAAAARDALTWDAAAADHERLYTTVLSERS